MQRGRQQYRPRPAKEVVMRKLATAALAFSAAVFLAYYLIPAGWLIVPAVLSAVLGALPGETLVFEDMVYAVETAADAGFAVVGIYDDNSQEDQKAIRGRCRWYLESFADWPGLEGLQNWKK